MLSKNDTKWLIANVLSSFYDKLKIDFATKKYVDDSIKNTPKKSSIENGVLYLLKEDGTKIDTGTTLPTLEEQAGEGNSIQLFTDLAMTEISFDNSKKIVESLDELIDTYEVSLNQVFRGQCNAKDNPINGNCEIEIEILKIRNGYFRDIVCQIILSSVTDSPYKWIMMTRRRDDEASSTIKVPLMPMIPDVNKEYVDNAITKATDEEIDNMLLEVLGGDYSGN